MIRIAILMLTGISLMLLTGCGGGSSSGNNMGGGVAPPIDPVAPSEYDVETSCAQENENCQSDFEAAEKAIKDHKFTNENLFTQDRDLEEILADRTITDDQDKYLRFLFEHRQAEYLLNEGVFHEGIQRRPGIYHDTHNEPPYKYRLGSENYGAWLTDPEDGTAFVYVNTYFKPTGYVDYPTDEQQITKLEATFEGKVKGYARVNSKPNDIEFEAGTFTADIKLQANAGKVDIVGTVDNFHGTHHNSWDKFAFTWNPVTGALMPDATYTFGDSPPDYESTRPHEETSSLDFYRQAGQMDPAGIGGHLHMDFGVTGEAIGAFDAPKMRE